MKNCELNLYVSRDGLSHCTKIIISRSSHLKFFAYSKQHSAHSQHASSGCLKEVKNIRKSLTFQAQKVVADAYRGLLFTRGYNCKVLTGKVSVFWMDGRLWQMVTYMKWSHREVRLYEHSCNVVVSVTTDYFLSKSQTISRFNIFNIKVNFYSYKTKTHFQLKGFTAGSILKVSIRLILGSQKRPYP